MVVLGGPKGTPYHVKMAVEDMATFTITPYGKDGKLKEDKAERVDIAQLDWNSEQPVGDVSFCEEGDKYEDRVVQYLGRTSEGYVIRYLGSEQNVIVRSLDEHRLSAHMLAPEVKDFSKFLLCPMPGTLISVSVHDGQRVEAGQQLAVVEAMKMQNVLRAERAGVVKHVKKAAGSPLKVDEVIIEFETSN